LQLPCSTIIVPDKRMVEKFDSFIKESCDELLLLKASAGDDKEYLDESIAKSRSRRFFREMVVSNLYILRISEYHLTDEEYGKKLYKILSKPSERKRVKRMVSNEFKFIESEAERLGLLVDKGENKFTYLTPIHPFFDFPLDYSRFVNEETESEHAEYVKRFLKNGEVEERYCSSLGYTTDTILKSYRYSLTFLTKEIDITSEKHPVIKNTYMDFSIHRHAVSRFFQRTAGTGGDLIKELADIKDTISLLSDIYMDEGGKVLIPSEKGVFIGRVEGYDIQKLIQFRRDEKGYSNLGNNMEIVRFSKNTNKKAIDLDVERILLDESKIHEAIPILKHIAVKTFCPHRYLNYFQTLYVTYFNLMKEYFDGRCKSAFINSHKIFFEELLAEVNTRRIDFDGKRKLNYEESEKIDRFYKDGDVSNLDYVSGCLKKAMTKE